MSRAGHSCNYGVYMTVFREIWFPNRWLSGEGVAVSKSIERCIGVWRWSLTQFNCPNASCFFRLTLNTITVSCKPSKYQSRS